MSDVRQLQRQDTGFAIARPDAQIVTDWTCSTSVPQFVDASLDGYTGYRVEHIEPNDCVRQLSRIKEASGLTWEEIAKILGTTRRTIHSWVAGSTVRTTNAQRVHALYNAMVQTIGDQSPVEARTHLITPDEDGNIQANLIARRLREQYKPRQVSTPLAKKLGAVRTDDERSIADGFDDAIEVAPLHW